MNDMKNDNAMHVVWRKHSRSGKNWISVVVVTALTASGEWIGLDRESIWWVSAAILGTLPAWHAVSESASHTIQQLSSEIMSDDAIMAIDAVNDALRRGVPIESILSVIQVVSGLAPSPSPTPRPSPRRRTSKAKRPSTPSKPAAQD